MIGRLTRRCTLLIAAALLAIGGGSALLLAPAASAQMSPFGFPPTNSALFQIAGVTQVPQPIRVNFSTGLSGSLASGTLTITLSGAVGANFTPTSDATYTLGAPGLGWKRLYLQGTPLTFQRRRARGRVGQHGDRHDDQRRRQSRVDHGHGQRRGARGRSDDDHDHVQRRHLDGGALRLGADQHTLDGPDVLRLEPRDVVDHGDAAGHHLEAQQRAERGGDLHVHVDCDRDMSGYEILGRAPRKALVPRRWLPWLVGAKVLTTLGLVLL